MNHFQTSLIPSKDGDVPGDTIIPSKREREPGDPPTQVQEGSYLLEMGTVSTPGRISQPPLLTPAALAFRAGKAHPAFQNLLL